MTSLSEFIEEHRDAITHAVLRAYPPIYSARNRGDWGFDLGRLRRQPLGGQADAIRALAVSLRRQRGTNLVGEMGTGKTTIATAAAYLGGFQCVLVLCPPHLVRKWKREIEATIPRVSAVIASSTTDLGRLPPAGDRAQFVIVSRERAKLSYRWKPAVVSRLATSGGRLSFDIAGDPLRRLCCPACYVELFDREGLPLEIEALTRKKHACDACGSPLWQADRDGPRRYPLADYVARRLPGVFDLLIVDEQHEYKARGSAQGIAAGTLAEACGRTLTLTGTLMGGYASTLFHLLWRFSPEVREEFGYGDEGRWVSRYGIVERITRRTGDDESYEDGRTSRRRGYRTRTLEKPGVSPAVLFHLIGNTVFLRLADVASDLPPYGEEVRLLSMDRGDGRAPSQASSYRQLADALHAAVTKALASGSRRLLAAYLQALLAFPDACTQGETVLDAESGEIIALAEPLPEDRLYPKERALLERGNLAHRAIELWFTRGERPPLNGLADVLDPRLDREALERVCADVDEMLDRFDASALAATLRDPQTRAFFELPFSWHWDGVPVHGTIDLAYERESQWRIVDFKTDEIGSRTLDEVAAPYLPQLALYAGALTQAIGRPPASGLLFLRTGTVFEAGASDLANALANTRRRVDAGPLLDEAAPPVEADVAGS